MALLATSYKTLLNSLNEKADQNTGIYDYPDTGIYDYSNEDDFYTLWQLSENSANPSPNPNHKTFIIIIWTDIWENHSSPPLVRSHLTPLDWALAYSTKQLDEGVAAPSIHILDLTGTTESARWLKNTPKKSLPGVSLYAPITREGYQSITDLISLDSGILLPSIKDQEKDPIYQKDLSECNQKWRGELESGSGDHHDIKNYIGPTLLCTNQKSIYRAFSNRICWSLAKSTEPVTNPKPFDLKQQNQDLRIVLIDDQLDNGWAYAFRSYLGLKKPDGEQKKTDTSNEGGIKKLGESIELRGGSSPKVELWGGSSPLTILESLEEKTLKSKAEFLKFKTVEENDLPEILFFDLRFFPVENDGCISGEEKKYLWSCLKKFKKLTKKDTKELPQKDTEEMNAIGNWLKTDKPQAETPEHHHALTLLPRILATLDPSYPIVLFSATGRRDILETVKGFKNIITKFEKPDLDTCLHEYKRQNALDNFHATIEESLKIIKARQLCRQFRDLVPSEEAEGSKKEPKGPSYHVELFIDETGLGRRGAMDNLRVGGCYALFSGDDRSTAQQKSYAFDDALVRHGVIYSEHQKIGRDNPEELTRKDKGCGCVGELANAMKEDCKCKPDMLGLVAIEREEEEKKEEEENQSEFFKDASGDENFFIALELLIEGFLYAGLPEIAFSKGGVEPEDISVSIFAGSRINSLFRFDFAKKYNIDGLKKELEGLEGLEEFKGKLQSELKCFQNELKCFGKVEELEQLTLALKKLKLEQLVKALESAQKQQHHLGIPYEFKQDEQVIQITQRSFTADQGNLQRIVKNIISRQPSKRAIEQAVELRLLYAGDSYRKPFCRKCKRSFRTSRNKSSGNIAAKVKAVIGEYALLELLKNGNENNEERTKRKEDILDAITTKGEMNELIKKLADNPDFKKCPSCGESGYLGIHALHYVADQILTAYFREGEGDDYGESFEPSSGEHYPGDFVDRLDDDLKKIMQLSSKIAQGGTALAEAIAEFPPLSTSDARTIWDPLYSQEKNNNKPRLRLLMAKQVARKLCTLDESDFFIIVNRLPEIAKRREQRKAARKRKAAKPNTTA